ncbi:MAG TPA: hypothetical protein VGL97_01885 [Bryobacteraceae bacterium]
MKTLVLWGALAASPLHLYSQFEVAGLPTDIHGFVSQGFAVSNHNNYLTMKTRDGSFALTDGGINVSSRISDKFRVGAQLYIMNVGELGAWRPQLDWAFGDYKLKDWLGFRVGKVKTTLGLYTDIQDEAFLTPWAILPQSLYPIDLRASTISHIGGDIYGEISLKRLGSLSYTAYVGERPNDRYGGYIYGLRDFGVNLDSYDGRMEGGDLRWNTPVTNLLVGASYLVQNVTGKGTSDGLPHLEKSNADETSQYYVQYAVGPLHFDGEYRRHLRDQVILDSNPSAPPEVYADGRGFYGSAAYTLSKKWEVGTYYSRFYANWKGDLGAPDNHIFDKVATVRFNFDSHFNLKIEGHFIDGYGALDSIRGFYTQNNPSGLKPKTNMLVIRMGYSF